MRYRFAMYLFRVCQLLLFFERTECVSMEEKNHFATVSFTYRYKYVLYIYYNIICTCMRAVCWHSCRVCVRVCNMYIVILQSQWSTANPFARARKKKNQNQKESGHLRRHCVQTKTR
jgi:hypothetical protein